MWNLAFRNVFRQKARTSLTLAAIVIGVAMLIIAGGFVEDFFIQLREATIHSQLGHLQIYKSGYYRFGRRAPFDYLIEKPDQQIHQLQGVQHVIDILPRVNFSALLSNGRSTFGVLGEGVDPVKEKKLSAFLKVISGRELSSSNLMSILLGEGVANTLKLKPGDHVNLLLNTSGGALNSLDFEVAGIFRTFSKDYDNRTIRIPISAAQELLGTNGVHALVVALDDTSSTEAVAREIKRRLPQEQFEIKTWYELADFYQKAVDLYRRYFTVLRLIILGMVLLAVANSVNMTIYERIGEFGTLMALGNRKGRIWRIIFAENLILGLLGSGAGALLGVTLALVISAVGIPMPPMPNTNSGYIASVRVVPSEVEISFVVGLAATCLAAVLPAWRACRTPVVRALARN